MGAVQKCCRIQRSRIPFGTIEYVSLDSGSDQNEIPGQSRSVNNEKNTTFWSTDRIKIVYFLSDF